jgi:hypothetical protein
MMLAAIEFLVATAAYSKRKLHLFKNSILAVMHYGIEGNGENQQELARETDSDLIKAAKGVKLTFGRRSNGKSGVVKSERG